MFTWNNVFPAHDDLQTAAYDVIRFFFRQNFYRSKLGSPIILMLLRESVFFSLSLYIYIYIYIYIIFFLFLLVQTEKNVNILKRIGQERILVFYIFILYVLVFLPSCCRQKAFNDLGSVVFNLYLGDSFDNVGGPFQFSDKFSFRPVLVLSFSFFFFFFLLQE